MLNFGYTTNEDLKLDIEIWDGGLQEHEVTAIKKIKETFTKQKSTKIKSGKKSIPISELKGALSKDNMFPWKGYAGFRFVGKGKEGEFDLVIITHCNIIIVELKHWNHQPIKANGDVWFKGNKNMGRSPVSVTRNKKFLLENKLKKLVNRFTNVGFRPYVEFFVVMTGNADFSSLPEDQLQHTISLNEFLRLSDIVQFENKFKVHSKAKVLNKDFPIFDELFKGNETQAKPWNYAGYVAKEKIFEHPQKVYSEFIANAEDSKDTEALMRVWKFNNIEGNKAYTPDGRADIVSREREILNFINHHNRELYNHCLRSLTSFQKDELTAEYSEVYELPPGHLRFNEFIGKFGVNLTDRDRINLVKILISRFADLHEMKVAHRDIADHSLWLSGSKAISLSNFISAYHQPIGTVGDYRHALSVGAVEIKDLLGEYNLTPFQHDVHALGVVSWHLLVAKPMTPKSLQLVSCDLKEKNNWYTPILLNAVTAKYKDASEFFNEFIENIPVSEEIAIFDDKELDKYRREINHSRQFREDEDFIVERSDKEVYISEGRLIKVWLNIDDRGNNPSESFGLLNFLKVMDKLSLVSPMYLPTIQEYGIASKSQSLYLVSSQIKGATWDKAIVISADRIGIIKQFVSAVENLHSLNIAHGDIHPANVMIEYETNQLFLIDIPDYSSINYSQKNHLYSPEYIDNCTAFERDNYAVMKMSCELLGIPWAEISQEYSNISHVVLEELEDTNFGFKELGRFRKALLGDLNNDVEVIEVIAGRANETITILPDNGKLYVKVEKGAKNGLELKVHFTGVGGSFDALYCTEKKSFIVGFDPKIRASVNKWEEELSDFEINKAIRITAGRPFELNNLSEVLNSNDSFLQVIESVAAESNTIHDPVPTTVDLKVAFHKLDMLIEDKKINRSLNISTAKLWRAILDTETESYPNIEVNGSVIVSSSSNNVIIPYSSDTDPLDVFNSGDEVEALFMAEEGVERFIGDVLLNKSALKEVCIKNARSAVYSLKEGDYVYFRSKQDRASFRKRKIALERLLDREGVQPHLIDLFEPSCNKTATNYGITVSDEDFARYDREDEHGNKISLNEQQRKAFIKLLNNGPLSLLQGPPGTGKTEFIAAFVHYLVEKQEVKRILLVSQSHEAVNTAAERIRKHCSRLKTALEVVRFSNREAAVSDGLKDVFSASITMEKRTLFEVEYKHRVAALSNALGIEADFISALLQAELKLFKQMDSLQSLLASESQDINKSEIEELKRIAIELDQSIRTKLISEYAINMSEFDNLKIAKERVIEKLCQDYAIRPHQITRARALAKISRDMINAWEGERVNCDEFYARSRQLVTGTCVGIGQGHIGVQDNIYDWVIIDEAARSIASELAIAMQSAKRVLLVGDHLQLPPLYSDAHKKALARRLGITGDKEELDEILQSDFARAFDSEYGKQTNEALLTQYRMAPAIGNLVSKIFYNGKLLNGIRKVPDIYLTAPRTLKNVVTWLDTAQYGDKAHHTEPKGKSRSISNRCEADQVIELLKEIDENVIFVEELSKLVHEGEAAIGVICMYAEQKRLIRQKFNQEIWSDGFRQLVKIDTVDSYQGKENRIIILSVTRSDKKHSPGFLRAPNRINVAMSRAMDRLVILGNVSMWKGSNAELPLGEVASFMTSNGEKEGYFFINANINAGKKN